MPTAALHQQLAGESWEAGRAAGPVAPLTDLTTEDAYASRPIDVGVRGETLRAGRLVPSGEGGRIPDVHLPDCSVKL